MKKAYKLTTQEMTTYNDCEWKVGEWKKVKGEGELCSEGWLHFYTSPDLAVLLNPIHADIENPRLWEAEVRGKSRDDDGTKVGWSEARLVKEIKLPEWTTTQKVAFGILCALEVYKEEGFVRWARDWLSGTDRSVESAELEERVARAAWWAARAASAERAAVWAAWWAARAVSAERAARAARAEERAAWWAAEWAARAAWAAWAVASAAKIKELDFIRLIKKAKKIK